MAHAMMKMKAGRYHPELAGSAAADAKPADRPAAATAAARAAAAGRVGAPEPHRRALHSIWACSLLLVGGLVGAMLPIYVALSADSSSTSGVAFPTGLTEESAKLQDRITVALQLLSVDPAANKVTADAQARCAPPPD
jgi:hypothetical protein